jgi:hypothetical protein
MLPAELRLKVYEMVLSAAGGELEIMANGNKKRDRWDVRAAGGKGCDMTFLRTCRRMHVSNPFPVPLYTITNSRWYSYREALPTLFSTNTFIFHALDVFAAFIAIVPTHHLAHIRQLVFTTTLTDRYTHNYRESVTPFYSPETQHEVLLQLLASIPGSRQLCLRYKRYNEESFDLPVAGDFRMLEQFENQGRVEGLEVYYEILGTRYEEWDAGTLIDGMLFERWKVGERTRLIKSG